MPYYELGRQAVLMLYKARGMAYAIGDIRALASLDIIIGSEATRQFHTSNRNRLWQTGQRGKSAMATLSDWDMRSKLSLYLGILDFDQGYYQTAVGHFSLCQYFEASPEHEIYSEISQLYLGHSASLLGDFSLGTSILRKRLRLSSSLSDHHAQAMYKIHLCSCLLAQGYLEEPLELIDSVIGCLSPKAEPRLWLCALAVLAYYHRLAGYLEKGYSVFAHGMARAGGKKQISYFFYHMPFFIELLNAWDEAGFPPIPECEFSNELQYRLEGHNEMLKAVCLRLKGQRLEGELTPQAQKQAAQALERSLSLSRELGVARERAKTCVILARLYMADGRNQAALALAMEAWSLSHMLRHTPWIQILTSMVPAPADLERGADTLSPETFFDHLSTALMEETPDNLQDFYTFIIKTICRLFGVKRGCLLRAHESTNHYLVLSRLGMSEEEINSRSFLPQASLVEKALLGAPVFTAINNPNALDKTLSITCLPILGRNRERYALYLDGEILPQLAKILTQETLLNICRILAWEFVRFERNRGGAPRKKQISPKLDDDAYSIIYQSRIMNDFLESVDDAARSDAAITIYGETGTGKELVARRIHAISGRKGPFVAINLSSMPEELFENEMFGHERGAFTGALQCRTGLVELADKGTLFIDEIPDISQRIQIKLLRLLQEKVFSRLGTTRLVHSDFRLIVATNRNMRRAVQEGRFREDLFYRICVIPLVVPPLRERGEDILPIVKHYFDLYCNRYRKQLRLDLDEGRQSDLLSYQWPGNVRELKNMVEQTVIRAKGNHCITALPLPETYLGDQLVVSPLVNEARPNVHQEKVEAPVTTKPFFEVPRPAPGVTDSVSDMVASYYGQLPSLRQVEEGYIDAVMQFTGGKIDGEFGAAGILGLKRSALYYRLDKMRKAASKL